jgi:hypothetical protein
VRQARRRREKRGIVSVCVGWVSQEEFRRAIEKAPAGVLQVVEATSNDKKKGDVDSQAIKLAFLFANGSIPIKQKYIRPKIMGRSLSMMDSSCSLFYSFFLKKYCRKENNIMPFH